MSWQERESDKRQLVDDLADDRRDRYVEVPEDTQPKKPTNPKTLYPANLGAVDVDTEVEVAWDPDKWAVASNDSESAYYYPEYFDGTGNKYDGYKVLSQARPDVYDTTAHILYGYYCEELRTGNNDKTWRGAVQRVIINSLDPCSEEA